MGRMRILPRHHFSPLLHQSAAPFSHYVQYGETGYTAGIIGQRADTGALVSADLGKQCEAMFTNLETLLTEHGLTLGSLLRVTLYLTDYQDFEAINNVYGRRIPAPYPARTTLQVAALPLGARVQLDAVVAVG